MMVDLAPADHPTNTGRAAFGRLDLFLHPGTRKDGGFRPVRF
jgi:hypothetical protein